MKVSPNRARRRWIAASTLGSLLLLTACGSPTEDNRFEADPATYPLNCLNHQPHQPGPAYTSDTADTADTAAIFTMLKYYTANKNVTGYCDGKNPTNTDRAWAKLYIDLGAEPDNVARLLNEKGT